MEPLKTIRMHSIVIDASKPFDSQWDSQIEALQLNELRVPSKNEIKDEIARSLDSLQSFAEMVARRESEARSHQWATGPLLLSKYLKADYWRSEISEILYSLAEAIEPDDQD